MTRGTLSCCRSLKGAEEGDVSPSPPPRKERSLRAKDRRTISRLDGVGKRAVTPVHLAGMWVSSWHPCLAQEIASTCHLSDLTGFGLSTGRVEERGSLTLLRSSSSETRRPWGRSFYLDKRTRGCKMLL